MVVDSMTNRSSLRVCQLTSLLMLVLSLFTQEIAILSQTFERVVDRKQNVITALSRDIEEAEEQYNVSVRQHFFAVDTLIGQFV